MRQIIKLIPVILCFCMLSCSGYAQNGSIKKTPWVSDKGYWVAESNIRDPLTHTIRFYDNERNLIHTEQLTGVKLDLSRKKTKMKLKNALEQTIILYSQHRQPQQVSDYLVAYLK